MSDNQLEVQMTSRAKVEEVVDYVLKATQARDLIEQAFDTQLLIAGQPFAHWKDVFYVACPTEFNSETIGAFSVTLLNLNQEAIFHFSWAQCRLQMTTHGNTARFTSKFNALVAEYQATGKRLPAAATLEQMAKRTDTDMQGARMFCEMEMKFWKSVLEHLARQQSIAKQQSIQLQSEMKLTNSQ